MSSSNQPIVTKQNGDVAIQAAVLLHEERRFARGQGKPRLPSELIGVQMSRVAKLQRCGRASQQFSQSFSHPICGFYTLFHAVMASISVLVTV